jgi:hypothetical protein
VPAFRTIAQACGLPGFFDPEWYLADNPDVEEARVKPLDHYLAVGAREGRDPNPLFDHKWYLERNPDVATAGIHPLIHYLTWGAEEGRDPSPHFHTMWYLQANPDVKLASINPLLHYLSIGAAERRQPTVDEDSGEKILSLYRRYPALRRADYTDPKLKTRAFLFEKFPKKSVCAELGVFTGRFSQAIIKQCCPSVFYSVDPWWKKYGDFYPDWGEYTASGTLTTRAAYEATQGRCGQYGARYHIVVESSFEWLQSLDDNSLDWIYLDSTHEHEDTLKELFLTADKLKPDGTIFGDDWIPEVGHMHHGVFKAVHEFISVTDFRLIFAGMADQWILKRIP